MPYAVEIRPAERRAVIRGRGPADVNETIAMMRKLAEDPAFEPGFGMLVDVREQAYIASFDDLLVLRDVFEELRDAFAGPIAVIVPDLLRYGITRTISGLTAMFGLRIEAFREEPEAQAWLDAGIGPA